MTTLVLAAVVVSELAVGLAASADLATTEMAMRRPGFEEANPFMQEPAIRVLGKAVVATAVVAGSRKLRRSGHKNAAKVLCWTAVGLWLGAAAWNTHQMHRSMR